MITLFFPYERSGDGEGQQSLIHHQGGGGRRKEGEEEEPPILSCNEPITVK